MPRHGESADLDTVEPDADDGSGNKPADGAEPRSSTGRRRWPWIAVAGSLAALAALAFPVRVRLAEAQSRRLDRRWSEAVALDNGRNGIGIQLRAAAVEADRTAVDQASAALDAELAKRFDRISHQIGHELIIDSGVRGLAKAERSALAKAARRVRGHDATLLDAGGNVQRQLARERSRWHRAAVQPRTPVRGLHAADRELETLKHWSDVPTGAVLATTFGDHVNLLDVDHGSSTSLDQPLEALRVGARRGWMAVIASRSAPAAWAVPLTGAATGPPVELGPTEFAVPALRDDAAWLESFATTPPTCTEVDGSGHVLATARVHLLGETTAGLVVYLGDGDAPSGVALQHLDGSQGPTIPMPVGAAFSVGRSAVAWLDVTAPRPYPAVIWSAATGESRTIAPPAGFSAVLTGRFTPDGARLAVLLVPDNPGSSVQPAVVDVASGDVHVLPAPEGDAQGGLLAWSPDGRLLVLYAFGPRHPFTIYRPDTSEPPQTLRAHDVNIGDSGFAVVQP